MNQMISADAGDTASVTTYLKDYQPPAYAIDKTALRVNIQGSDTEVDAELEIRLIDNARLGEALFLHGEQLQLKQISIDGSALAGDDYSLSEQGLTLLRPAANFRLTTRVAIDPVNNTSLEGLYKSRTMYCTQCEAEGFRKITYYLDRPDAMSDFTTTIEADKASCPVLLSNGNLIDTGDLDDGRHFATWHDPFKKPCYLFALVAGDLACISDTFTTMSGREIALKLYVEEKDLDKCEHAITSLKNSMRWDEQTYGREYDLDIFMIVAVDDFNMGAMENKGLNIFNTSCVLANPTTTTDAGYQRVEGVVAHEYFHNWSGNRVTCRDWFQLSLKEGFTVYRDSEFSAEMNSPTVKRVEDVAFLRTLQFAEDAGPMAHPVRPASYMEISNFYTLTIYEKGSEVVRMLANLLGPEQFRAATDLYFDRHDGQAVTTEDFVQAMADVSGRDFSQFQRWYDQAGTPVVQVTDEYDADRQRYTLIFSQSTPATPECKNKLPFVIPVAMGLIGAAGELPLRLVGQMDDDLPADNTHRVLEFTEEQQRFVFTGVTEKPVPSLLRGFSAPVKLRYDYSREALAELMRLDSDGFNRWEASQKLALAVLDDGVRAWQAGTPEDFKVAPVLVNALASLLAHPPEDKAMLALMLTLPSEGYIAEQYELVDIEAIHFARKALTQQLALALTDEFRVIVDSYDATRPYQPDAASVAARSLKNLALSYLMAAQDDRTLVRCHDFFSASNNMTDQLAALAELVQSEHPDAQPLAQSALEQFYEQWSHEALVVNQWFGVQARNSRAGALDRVEALLQHPAYDASNPNKIRALISAFAMANPMGFHGGRYGDNSAGYRFLADQIIALNSRNPQIAAGLLRPLVQWRRYSRERQAAMQAELKRIHALEDLSPDVFEVVTKALA